MERDVIAVCLTAATSHQYQLVVLPRLMQSLQHRNTMWKLVLRALKQLGEQTHADGQRSVVLVRKQIGQGRACIPVTNTHDNQLINYSS